MEMNRVLCSIRLEKAVKVDCERGHGAYFVVVDDVSATETRSEYAYRSPGKRLMHLLVIFMGKRLFPSLLTVIF
jgi:hypothetical protein